MIGIGAGVSISDAVGLLPSLGGGGGAPDYGDSLFYYPLDDNNSTTYTDLLGESATLATGHGTGTITDVETSDFNGVTHAVNIQTHGKALYHNGTYNLATTDLTVEIFHKQTISNTFTSFGFSTDPTTSGAYAHMYTNDGISVYTNAATVSGSANITSGLTLTNVVHFCIQSISGTLYYSVDGNVFATATATSTNVYPAFGVRLHSDQVSFSRWSQFVITDGGKYGTSNFTAPTSPLF